MLLTTRVSVSTVPTPSHQVHHIEHTPAAAAAAAAAAAERERESVIR